jgi:hypothetical protein
VADVRPLTASEMVDFLDDWKGPGFDHDEAVKLLAELVKEVDESVSWHQKPWFAVANLDAECTTCVDYPVGKKIENCAYHRARKYLGLKPW